MEQIKLGPDTDVLELIDSGYAMHGYKGNNEHTIFKDGKKYTCVHDYGVRSLNFIKVMNMANTLDGIYFDKNIPEKC